MNQPASRWLKWIALSVMILLLLPGCRLVSLLTTTTPTLTPTDTPDAQNCFWTWAYGSGSQDYDAAVTKQLAAQVIAAKVNSSSYGEIYSCDQSFHAMALDVNVTVTVESIADQGSLIDLSDRVAASLNDNLSVSGIPNMGNIRLSFVTPDGNTCFWNSSELKCSE